MRSGPTLRHAPRPLGRRPLRIWGALLAATLLPTLPSQAQNHVTNGDFASDVSGWSFTTPGSFTFDAGPTFDADADAGSGSGHLENQSPVAFGTSFAQQCVDGVYGGRTFDVGAEIYFDSGAQTASGRANVVFHFRDAPACGGSTVGGSATPNVLSSTTDTWVTSEVTGVTSPPTTQSAIVNLFTNKTESTGTLDVHFDNVRLEELPRVPGLSPLGVALLALALAAGVSFSLRRRAASA